MRRTLLWTATGALGGSLLVSIVVAGDTARDLARRDACHAGRGGAGVIEDVRTLDTSFLPPRATCEYRFKTGEREVRVEGRWSLYWPIPLAAGVALALGSLRKAA